MVKNWWNFSTIHHFIKLLTSNCNVCHALIVILLPWYVRIFLLLRQWKAWTIQLMSFQHLNPGCNVQFWWQREGGSKNSVLIGTCKINLHQRGFVTCNLQDLLNVRCNYELLDTRLLLWNIQPWSARRTLWKKNRCHFKSACQGSENGASKCLYCRVVVVYSIGKLIGISYAEILFGKRKVKMNFGIIIIS